MLKLPKEFLGMLCDIEIHNLEHRARNLQLKFEVGIPSRGGGEKTSTGGVKTAKRRTNDQADDDAKDPEPHADEHVEGGLRNRLFRRWCRRKPDGEEARLTSLTRALPILAQMSHAHFCHIYHWILCVWCRVGAGSRARR